MGYAPFSGGDGHHTHADAALQPHRAWRVRSALTGGVLSHCLGSSRGKGLVTGYEGDKMTVLFDKVGYKTLAVDFVLGQDLLKRLGESTADDARSGSCRGAKRAV